MVSSDSTYMQRCLALAARGEFTARPNPMVGAVVVAGDEIVGEGWHQVCGQAHAEVNALEAAGGKTAGATLYVTLEPCSHWGRTGPCCDRIIQAGIARVVFGMHDPNPEVTGRGERKLSEAGVQVDGPVMEEDARALNPGFIKRMTLGLPHVRCKSAMSLDGRTAMSSGESKWITGEAARLDVQKWRGRSGAVVTGVDTVLADDPGLNARLEVPHLEQPLRVIVDSGLRTPASARILTLPGEVLIATAVTRPDLIEDKRGEFTDPVPAVLSFADEDGKVDLAGLMAYLARERGCNDVLVESGARLAGAMLRAGVVDELVTYVAPRLLGSDARPLFSLPGMARMAESIELEIVEVAMLGKDCRMRSRVVNLRAGQPVGE